MSNWKFSLTDLVFRVIFPRTHFAGKPEKKPNLSLSSLYISFGFTFINMLHSKKKKKRSKMHFSKYKNAHISIYVFQKGKPHYRNLRLQQETWMHHITLSKRGGGFHPVSVPLLGWAAHSGFPRAPPGVQWLNSHDSSEWAGEGKAALQNWVNGASVCGGCVCNVEGMVGRGWVVRGTLNFIAWQRPMLRQFLMYPLMC